MRKDAQDTTQGQMKNNTKNKLKAPYGDIWGTERETVC
jgi:hypothetical protein